MPTLKTPSVPAVERTLAIFEILSQARLGLTLSELARRMQVPKSSLHCVLLTLERTSYVNRNRRTGRYLLALKLFGIANSALSGLKVREVAEPFLRALMEETQLTIHLAILERSEAVLVERVEPPGLIRLATWVGKRMDVHCTSVGKALAAGLTEEQLNRVIHERPLLRHNDNTIVSVTKLKKELARVKEMGYAVDDEEEEIGLRCIGVPIRDASGTAVAAISIGGTTGQITESNVGRLAERVKKAAAGIAEALQLGQIEEQD
jgi:DNA-binding IclR family transcriptional regulator